MTSSPSDGALLSAILETAVDGIVTIDKNGKIRNINPAAERMFGYETNELVGKDITLLMPEPHRSQHDQYIRRYLETGEKRIIGIGREVHAQRKDGSLFPMLLSVSEVCFGDEHYFAGIIHDITERHELEQARSALIEDLERANAELERFTYTVSHDLKSPLITIKGFLGAIARDAETGNLERLNRDLARIEKAADKMKMLLDELLQLSRIGRIVNPPQHFDMTELCREVVGLLEGPITAQGAEVSVGSGMGSVYADRTRIAEVIQNAIENALKFTKDTKPHARIEIGSRDDDGTCVFYIRDNGVGVDSQYLGRIFRLFEQLDQHQEGTGIGLALAKRIIEVHKGRIWAESEGIGHGTTICFTIGTVEEQS
jgi:two-component system sensor kinase FixL